MSTPETDGWIEVRRSAPTSAWEGAVRLFPIATVPISQVYDCLFLPGNTGFEPLAFNRGIPLDASREVRCDVAADRWEYPIFHTWILWSEIRDMDWDEVAPLPDLDDDARVYVRGPDGALVFQGWDTNSRHRWRQGEPEQFEADGKVYRFERITRRETLTHQPEWRMLIGFMAQLAELFGPENVRMTVWFGAGYVPWESVDLLTRPAG